MELNFKLYLNSHIWLFLDSIDRNSNSGWQSSSVLEVLQKKKEVEEENEKIIQIASFFFFKESFLLGITFYNNYSFLEKG